MFTDMSTHCLLRTAAYAHENQQMVDSTLEARLEQAWTAHGLTRASFAAGLGKDGQQKLTNWIQRNRIGQPSLAAVRQLLPQTNMEWLNDGIGHPLFTPSLQSQVLGTDLAKLTSAVEFARSVSELRAKKGAPRFTARQEAEFLAGLYDLLIQPEQGNLAAVLEFVNKSWGDENVGQDEVGSADEDGPRWNWRDTR